MPEGVRWRYVLPEPIREMGGDLAAVIGCIGLTVGAVYLPVVNETPLRIPLGLLFLLFIPGYVFIAALFPAASSPGAESPSTRTDDTSPTSTEGIDGIERLALSIGTSIAISPLIGLVLNFTPWGIRLGPIVIAVGGFSLITAFIANQRRRALPPQDRFAVPYREWITAVKADLFHPATTADAVVNVVLIASMLLAAGSVGYAIAVPSQGESFSELYLLTEDETGEFVADDYPTEFTQGDTASVFVGIGNHEHERVEYTVVAELQRVQFENNSTRVLEEAELQRFQATLAHNETHRFRHTIRPPLNGERLRLVYLLYRGPPPSEPTVTNAYREVHLWVNVTASSSTEIQSSLTQSSGVRLSVDSRAGVRETDRRFLVKSSGR